VLLNQRDPGSPLLPSFIPDDYANAFQVTKHLIACGATRIAHITGESWMEASRQRLAGYQAALQQAGLACDDGLVRQTNWQFSESFTATTPCWNWPSARTPSSAPATGWRLAAIRRWR
jgi:LacI family transcriptional regulator